ncbi:U3 small nucleolar ribonucleoprotein protein IMP4, partial [Geodia barretti]
MEDSSSPSSPKQLRRQARLRREYLYRKSLEDKERSILERKRKLRDALEGGRVIPTELQKDALELRKAMKYDDDEREGIQFIVRRKYIIPMFVVYDNSSNHLTYST